MTVCCPRWQELQSNQSLTKRVSAEVVHQQTPIPVMPDGTNPHPPPPPPPGLELYTKRGSLALLRKEFKSKLKLKTKESLLKKK